MALLLRLAVALDRRPEPVVKSLLVHVKRDYLVIKLIRESQNQNLSLEQWSLESCAQILQEVSGMNLKVIVEE